ncbi:MAG: YgiQ family radical SAM protein, partial [Candidatus Firestonebacteria bacterium]|nr:YgiQ family radical SAM protein [Candidatus Firestonebacteria bacterium]
MPRNAHQWYNPGMKQPPFLPMSLQEMKTLGWSELDVLLISGDAYVDHPSFGAALIGRCLIDAGFRVGIIAQPNWKDLASVTVLGRPRLFAGITAGAMDSLVANYTANKKLRRNDSYSPGGGYGFRPNRATIIYTNLVKHAFPGLNTVLGGIEASLRRLAHYDYWEDSIRRSLLLDAKADILVYGMGEKAVVQIAERLLHRQTLDNIAGTAVVRSETPAGDNVLALPGFEEVIKSKEQFIQASLLAETEQHWKNGKLLVQPHGARFVVVQPPAPPL